MAPRITQKKMLPRITQKKMLRRITQNKMLLERLAWQKEVAQARRNQQNILKLQKMRMQPDFADLHHILQWNYNHTRPCPPSALTNYDHPPPFFNNFPHLLSCMDPLLMCEDILQARASNTTLIAEENLAKVMRCQKVNEPHAAGDEVAKRLKEGVRGAQGELIIPKLVWIGTKSKVDMVVKDIFINELVEAMSKDSEPVNAAESVAREDGAIKDPRRQLSKLRNT
ncbi:uncharacterized protein VP01_2066g3 [Puccinia sorghi]|uniref:Uncharacterized protein n=1 Tax=Puccinia sorghi TaxID=27349 RepID=A0A0L6VAR8_9BASI|nr:uncharacterized protein VP01_2066g3 [Puccinia sorghi]